jgi:hypothetical protein
VVGDSGGHPPTAAAPATLLLHARCASRCQGSCDALLLADGHLNTGLDGRPGQQVGAAAMGRMLLLARREFKWSMVRCCCCW